VTPSRGPPCRSCSDPRRDSFAGRSFEKEPKPQQRELGDGRDSGRGEEVKDGDDAAVRDGVLVEPEPEHGGARAAEAAGLRRFFLRDWGARQAPRPLAAGAQPLILDVGVGCRYKRNGILPMLKRNLGVKNAPQRWQNNAADGCFDVVMTFEEKVFDTVIEGWSFLFPLLWPLNPQTAGRMQSMTLLLHLRDSISENYSTPSHSIRCVVDLLNLLKVY
ncbi:hypothetical protein BHE74_00021946, partial [Ensete ventricosum]